MLVTKASIQALMTSFSSLYGEAFGRVPNWSDSLATQLTSSTKTATYGWMTRLPGMREWIGPRVLNNLETEDYVLTNKTFENTIAVDVNDIEDDNLGVYSPMMTEFGSANSKWKDKEVKKLLQDGENRIGFDGKGLFAVDHPLDPAGVQSNLSTGTALTAENLEAVLTAMAVLTGNDGELLDVDPVKLVVPPQLAYTARVILAPTISGDEGVVANPLHNIVELEVIRDLANEATTWYVMDTTKAIKALVFQTRQAPVLTQKTSLNDDCVFEDDQFRMGVKARGAAGVGVWFLAHKCVG